MAASQFPSPLIAVLRCAEEHLVDSDFLDILDRGQRFLLTGHERPDGDCIGAEVALVHLLEALGKQAVICNPDPAPQAFDFLARHTTIDSVPDDGTVPDHDVLVLLDCAHLSRLGRLGQLVQDSSAPRVVIDHHVGSESGDGHACYVDASAPATGALVHRMFRHFGVDVSAAAAEGVFLSLVSDTGWFRYSNTTAEVFAVAAELVADGVDASRIYDAIHRRMHPDSVAFLATALGRSVLEMDGRFGHVVLEREMVDAAARLGFDLDGVMEPLRSVDGVEVVTMLKETSRGVKVSLRASKDVDVQRIAASLGGGGHVKAAGATFDGTVDACLSAIRDRVEEALRAQSGGGS